MLRHLDPLDNQSRLDSNTPFTFKIWIKATMRDGSYRYGD